MRIFFCPVTQSYPAKYDGFRGGWDAAKKSRADQTGSGKHLTLRNCSFPLPESTQKRLVDPDRRSDEMRMEKRVNVINEKTNKRGHAGCGHVLFVYLDNMPNDAQLDSLHNKGRRLGPLSVTNVLMLRV